MSRKSDLVAHEVRAFAKARHVGRKDLMSFCDEPVRDAPPAPAAVPGAVYEDECPAARLFLRRRCGHSRGSGWRFRYRFDDIPSRRSAVCLNTNISTGAQTPKSAACSTGFASASCAWVRRRTARAARSPSANPLSTAGPHRADRSHAPTRRRCADRAHRGDDRVDLADLCRQREASHRVARASRG
jgi:hypothetical protein